MWVNEIKSSDPIDKIRRNPTGAWEAIEALRAENERLKRDYAILEECSPPDWPREDFVNHIFRLWSDGTEDKYERLREVLEEIIMAEELPFNQCCSDCDESYFSILDKAVKKGKQALKETEDGQR